MNRERSIDAFADRDEPFDILVIGGGSTGLGVALDAALRGYDVALIERGDFASGTSSKSTKLIHGGLRYLKQGNIPLVRESLRERERLLRNASSLVTPLGFVLPCYDRWTSASYAIGLSAYDMLAGSKTLAKSRSLDARRVLELLPGLRDEGLRGGRLYFDAQFDDARLALTVAIAASANGATIANYVRATGLIKDADGRANGAHAIDEESGREFRITARAVINAAGPWADSVRHFDDPKAPQMIVPSQGAHLVFDRGAFGFEHALMIPKTPDGRILFAIPFEQSLIVGTTDTELSRVPEEPVARESEIEFILGTLNRALRTDVSPDAIRAVFAGVRPLVRSGESANTSKIARNHVVRISTGSSLVTVTGGKWTTFRQIAQDATDAAARVAGLAPAGCVTHDYSLDAHVSPVIDRAPEERVSHGINLSREDIVRMVSEEMVLRVEDVLARRRRALIHDANASAAAADSVAQIIAVARGLDEAWSAHEAEAFRTVASHCGAKAG